MRQLLCIPLAALLAALLASCSPEPSRARAARTHDGSYDVIVVGSGAGGGPLAARLAERGKRVLLLEAGRDVGGSQLYDVPAMHALATEESDAAWWFFVHHSADPEIDRSDSKWSHEHEGVLYPRGSALGGSTALNALVTVLPSRSDWDRMAADNDDPSWRAERMDRYFDRVREWLPIELPDPSLALGDPAVSSYLSAAALVAGGNVDGNGIVADPLSAGAALSALLRHDVNDELRRGETTGLYRLPLATSGGRRVGTRERILAAVAAGASLTVSTGTFVTKVLFAADGVTATGVEVVRGQDVYAASLQQGEAPREREQLYANEEVVLSAGAFNTPQLLMLSGIGRADALAEHGIDSQIELPGVGENLQDRYEAAVVTELREPLAIVAGCELGSDDDPCLRDWQDGHGVYQTSGFLASLLTRSAPDVALADLQIFAAPTDARGYYPGYAHDSAISKHRFSWLLLKAHTQNHDGTVRLTTSDPFARPLIEFRSYDEDDPLGDPDLRALVSGVRTVRRIEREMRRLHPSDPVREVLPGDALQTDAELASWIRRESWGHHACCTSKMGQGDDAVIDSRFRVHGAAHLRVVDASVFAQIPGTFLALPTFMVAEKAADTILEDWR